MRNLRKKECNTTLIIKKIVQRFTIQIIDTDQSQLSSLTGLSSLSLSHGSLSTLNHNSQVLAKAKATNARCARRRRPRPRCIFIKVELLEGVCQFMVVNSMVQSSITHQLPIFYANKHLHMFRQQSSSPLLNCSSCQAETRF
jgi:hypothetical protein